MAQATRIFLQILLQRCLGLTPGSVTVFGLVNDPDHEYGQLQNTQFEPSIAVLGQNHGGVRSPVLRQFHLAPTAPINVTAREVRAHFHWQ
mgnify:CR=1 FL=1